MRGNVKDIFTIFDGTDRELIIPVYQRNYDWGEKQCERLYDDLVDVIRKDRPKHFFGAVVGRPETGFAWVVIDGQQRLTTTSLLMLALSNSLAQGTINSDEDPELAQKIRRNYLEGAGSSIAKETKLKLKPVKHDLEAYQRLLTGEEPVENSSVTANYRYFVDRIALGELTGDELWTAIRRLEAMILDLEPHDDPQRIFESLNSTGKELKESDKIRNLVLMGLPTKKQEHLYEYFWNRIEQNVHFDTDAFVRFFLVSRTRKTPRFDAVYDAFKEYLESTEASVEEVLQTMRDYSENFRDLNAASTGVARADARLRRFNLLRHEVAMPALMPLLGDYRSGEIAADDFAATIELVDAYLFRRLVVGIPSNALSKIFPRFTVKLDVFGRRAREYRTLSHTSCSDARTRRVRSRPMRSFRRLSLRATSSTSRHQTVATSLNVLRTRGPKTTAQSQQLLSAEISASSTSCLRP